MPTTKTPSASTRGKQWQKVDLEAVAKIFRQHYVADQLPDATQCYHLANAINIVRYQKPPPVLNANRAFRRRREIYAAMCGSVAKLIEQLAEYPEFVSLRLDRLKTLQKVLEDEKEAFLGVQDPQVGQRRGAEWHKAAHLLSNNVEEALRLADRRRKYRGKKISRDKGGPFVLVVQEALIMAGMGERTPEAIAAVLAKSGT